MVCKAVPGLPPLPRDWTTLRHCERSTRQLCWYKRRRKKRRKERRKRERNRILWRKAGRKGEAGKRVGEVGREDEARQEGMA